MRSSNSVVGGVCGGIAEYYNFDPVFIRLLFLIGLIFGIFPAFIIYIILWICIPEE